MLDGSALVATLRTALAPQDLVTGDGIGQRHLEDRSSGAPKADRPLAVAFPRDTAQVSAVLRACHASGVPVVPQGGLTGMAGGALPYRMSVVVSTDKMSAIESIDSASGAMCLQAGVTLEVAQRAAEEAGLLLPLDIGSRGSCQMGGIASTNAGGMWVLRYGMARQMIIGLEAVMADGAVISDMGGLLKNNTGMDLKQLFIGSEGTLGLITRMIVRLAPRPSVSGTVLCSLRDLSAGIELLRLLRGGMGDALTAFEAMWPDFFALGTSRMQKPPLAGPSGLYVLVEATGFDASIPDRLSELVSAAMEDGAVLDAVVPQSEAMRRSLWGIREPSEIYASAFRPSIGFDVGIRLDQMEAFVDDCSGAITTLHAALRTIWYGHLADNNLHLGVKLVAGGPGKSEIQDAVYACVRDHGGTISAEHGIGVTKKAYLTYCRTPTELAAMRSIKHALDPKNIMNPGKVI